MARQEGYQESSNQHSSGPRNLVPESTPAPEQFQEDLARAQRLFQGGQHGLVESLLEKLHQEYPQNQEVSFLLAQTKMALAKFAPAGEIFGELIEKDRDNPSLHNSLATALVMAQDLGLAVDHYQRAVELDGGNTTYLTNLGKSLMMTEEWGRALAILDKARQRSDGEAYAKVLQLIDYCQEQMRPAGPVQG